MVYMYHIFIHSSIDGHLGYFRVLTIANRATANIGVHESFSIMFFPILFPFICLLPLRYKLQVVKSMPTS